MTYKKMLQQIDTESLAHVLELVQISTIKTVLNKLRIPYDVEKLQSASEEKWIDWLNSEVE